MKDPVDDFSVPFCTNEELEKVAASWRRALGPILFSKNVDPVVLFKRYSEIVRKDVEVVLVADEQLGRANALVTEDRRRVLLREGVAARAREGDVAAAFDVIHELGHFVLHPQPVRLARMTTGNRRQRFIREEESAEHQANYFARALLMSLDEVARYPHAEELSENCGVPLVHAELRLAEVDRLNRSSQKALPKPARLAWSLARRSPDHDPDKFALSRGGFLAERQRYLQPEHHYGWFEAFGVVVTYLEHRTD